MSATQDYVRELRVGDPVAKLVLRTIADFADWRTGECWPSIATMAEEAECCERTIIRKLKELEEKKIITITRRNAEDGSNLTNLITLSGYAAWRGQIVPNVISLMTSGPKKSTEGHNPYASQSPKHINRTYYKNIVKDEVTDVTVPLSDKRVFNEESFEESKNKKPSLVNPTSQAEPIASWSEVLSEGQEPRVARTEGKLVLAPELRSTWIGLLGDEQSLDLALTEIFPRVSGTKSGTALEVEVSSALARIAREKKDRDNRYSAAVESKRKKEAKTWTPSRW